MFLDHAHNTGENNSNRGDDRNPDEHPVRLQVLSSVGELVADSGSRCEQLSYDYPDQTLPDPQANPRQQERYGRRQRNRSENLPLACGKRSRRFDQILIECMHGSLCVHDNRE